MCCGVGKEAVVEVFRRGRSAHLDDADDAEEVGNLQAYQGCE